MLYILDYGGGNVASLANSVRSLGHDFKWVESIQDIANADKILFPGVGSFEQAMKSLERKGYKEPLQKYLKSGKPYMGICIGMQALFKSSDESLETEGLGIIDYKVGKFDNSTKGVPSIGWNGATLLDQAVGAHYGISEKDKYYFVHSYRASWDSSNPELKDWVLSVTRYGDEDYVSSVRKGNVFATQFHPEKSGKAGLAVLNAWLSENGTTSIPSTIRDAIQIEQNLVINGMTKRIVACLDVRANDQGDLVVTKGDQYDVRESSAEGNNVRNLGKPVELAKRYFAESADEICFLNITSFRSSPLQDQPMLAVVKQASETVFVPLTIGGGIRDTIDPDGTPRSALEVAGAYFRCGADKVSIGSDAVFAVEELIANNGQKTGKTSIESISYGYGAQAVVVSIDPKRVYVEKPEDAPSAHQACVVDLTSASFSADSGPNGERYCWYQCTVSGGRETRDIDVVQLAQGVEALGAGEILLNSIDKDGTKSGFDLRLVDLVKRNVGIPVVASSGAGKVEDFADVFQNTTVEAALAAGIFHRREVPIENVKNHLLSMSLPIR